METPHVGRADSLRKLYFTRTVFQVLWAGSVIATAVTKPGIAGVLLILYPLWDVACTVYDLNTSALEGSAYVYMINAVLGTATAIGIAFTIFQQPAYAIGIFGAWAFGAGLLQLTAGLIRRKQLGGQWAMILKRPSVNGGWHCIWLGGLQGKFHAKDLGGYAIFGAVYFLIAGILLSLAVPGDCCCVEIPRQLASSFRCRRVAYPFCPPRTRRVPILFAFFAKRMGDWDYQRARGTSQTSESGMGFQAGEDRQIPSSDKRQLGAASS